MRNFIYLAGILFLSLHFASCSGNECSATSDYLADIDSDCVEDASDNCVGTYNPDQFDGDEDEIGYACDADDTVDGSVNALLSIESGFNVAGFYEFSNNCGNFSSLKVEQSQNEITATDNSENNYQGLVSFNPENSLVTGSLKNEDQECDFVHDPKTGKIKMSCDCEFSGEKLFTHLRTE